MKNYNICFVLFIVMCFAQAGFCSGSLGSRIKLQDATSVSTKANSGPSYENNCLINDPMLNSALGGMSNIMQMQGMNGSSYSMQEQQKAQMDYVRQQQTDAATAPAEEE